MKIKICGRVRGRRTTCMYVSVNACVGQCVDSSMFKPEHKQPLAILQ